MRTLTLTIGGMHCDGCAERLSGVLDREHGVREAKVSYGTRSAEITFNETATSVDRLRQAIARAGFSFEGD